MASGLLAGTAHAQDLKPHAGEVYTRLGLTGVISEAGGDVYLAGHHLDGAGLSVGNNVTVAGELGYYVTPQLSISISLGVPPKTDVNGTGSIASFGRLGSARYGITVASLDYHYNGFGRFQPFIGAGPAYLSIFGTQDAALQQLHVDNNWGAAVRAGADWMMGSGWGFYGSVSQIFISTNGRGNAGPLPFTAKFSLNPMILQAGVVVRF